MKFHHIKISGGRGHFLCELDGVSVKGVRHYRVESGPSTRWIPVVTLEIISDAVELDLPRSQVDDK